MPDFILAYHPAPAGSLPDLDEAQGKEQLAKWQTWLQDLGDAVVNPGTPLGKSMTITKDGVTDGGGPNPLQGFSVIKADNLDAAVEIARTCPYLLMGTLEVAEMMVMPS